MHAKIKPNIEGLPTPTFPHCDARILHAPGHCEYCDIHPEWQKLRIVWGVAFTGFEPDAGELPDPATNARGLDHLNQWGGNRPKSKVLDTFWKDFFNR
jgi:hypothetical protein